MAVYKEIIASYEEADGFKADIVSAEVREIIDGIVTILGSRLAGFEDSGLDEDIAIEEKGNPIFSEKQATLDQVADDLKEIMDIRWQTAFQSACELMPRAHLAIQWLKNGPESVKMALLEVIRIHVFPSFYESYLEALAVCQNRLNDFECRKAVQFYKGMMEDEIEILSTIIKIQARALEQVVENGSDSTEKMIVHNILSVLRETYQRFGRTAKDIAAVFHHLEDSPVEQQKPEDYSAFEAWLADLWKQRDFESSVDIEDNIGLFKSQIEKEAEILLKRCRLEFLKSLYRFRQLVNDEKALADEMTAVFIKMKENWPKFQLETFAEKENEGVEILKGVAETIEIKIEGLRESSSQITEEYADIIESFTEKNAAPTDEETQAAKAAVWQLWMDSENLSGGKDLPIFTERRRDITKNAALCQETLNKKTQKFKRETLLYEMSTYEEIIFYSVSRLRQLESQIFQQGAALADDALKALEAILKKNNIEIIRPQPHEAFNSREHEVLMAESNPDFKKGEIVKMMNSGYRQDDVVLLRANVIAAR